jgi:hypothetical protein
MSHKLTIDDIQQSAQTIDNEYNIHVQHRAQELRQRFACVTNEILNDRSLSLSST